MQLLDKQTAQQILDDFVLGCSWVSISAHDYGNLLAKLQDPRMLLDILLLHDYRLVSCVDAYPSVPRKSLPIPLRGK